MQASICTRAGIRQLMISATWRDVQCHTGGAAPSSPVHRDTEMVNIDKKENGRFIKQPLKKQTVATTHLLDHRFRHDSSSRYSRYIYIFFKTRVFSKLKHHGYLASSISANTSESNSSMGSWELE